MRMVFLWIGVAILIVVVGVGAYFVGLSQKSEDVVNQNNEEKEVVLTAQEKDGKWGFVDETGREIIPFKYDEVEEFNTSGLVIVGLNGKYGMIDSEGKEVTEIKYDSISQGEGTYLLFVKLNDKRGFIDENGKEIIPIKYDEVGDIFGTRISLRLGDKWGILDDTGKEIIPFKYDDIYPSSDGVIPFFNENLIPIKLNGKWGFIDRTDKVIIPFKFDSVQFSYQYRTMTANIGNKTLVVTEDGEEVDIERIIDELGIKSVKTSDVSDVKIVCLDRTSSLWYAILFEMKPTNWDKGEYVNNPKIPVIVLKNIDTGEILTYKPIGDDVAFSTQIYYKDIDGDGGSEIIAQSRVRVSSESKITSRSLVGAGDGAGQYFQYVLKYEDDKLIDIFSNGYEGYIKTGIYKDFGFSAELQNDFKLKILNKYIKYEKTIDISQDSARLEFYDYNKNVKKDINVDYFYLDTPFSFQPIDFDKDGIFEIEALQYSSFGTYSNDIGTLGSILKYDIKTKKWDVIKAKFFDVDDNYLPLIDIQRRWDL